MKNINYVIGFLSLELFIAVFVLFGDLSISKIQIWGIQMPNTLGSQFLMFNSILVSILAVSAVVAVAGLIFRYPVGGINAQ